MILEIVDDIVGLVHGDTTVVIDEKRDLILSTEFNQLGVRLVVADLAVRRSGIVNDI